MEFNFKKKYGQNFLKNTKIIDKIINSIEPSSNDLIIEIGPGGGALTKKLKKYKAKMICYEVDIETQSYLSKLEDENTQVIYEDFLKRNIASDIKNIKYDKLYIIGNLPYYITTPIITKIVDEDIDVFEAVFMVQKEVADRLSAKINSRDYGAITVLLNYFFDITKLFIVGKDNFVPIPKVDSAVIKLKAKKEKMEVNVDKFKKIVRDAFQFKRKNLNNNLNTYNKEKMQEILKDYGYNLSNRAEEIPYNVFIDITNKYFN